MGKRVEYYCLFKISEAQSKTCPRLGDCSLPALTRLSTLTIPARRVLLAAWWLLSLLLWQLPKNGQRLIRIWPQASMPASSSNLSRKYSRSGCSVIDHPGCDPDYSANSGTGCRSGNSLSRMRFHSSSCASRLA